MYSTAYTIYTLIPCESRFIIIVVISTVNSTCIIAPLVQLKNLMRS